MSKTSAALDALKQAGLDALKAGDLPKYQDTLEAGARACVRRKQFDLAAEYMAQWAFIEYAAPHFGGMFDIENSFQPLPPWHLFGSLGNRELPGKIVNLIRTIPEYEKRIGRVLEEHTELFAKAFRCDPPEFDMMDKVRADIVDFDIFQRERKKGRCPVFSA